MVQCLAQIQGEIKPTVKEFISELSNEIPIQKVVVFISYACGNHHRESNIGLAIFSDYFEKVSRVEGIKFLLSKTKNYSRTEIQPIPFTNREYIEPDPFTAEVLRAGVEIF